MTPDERAKRLVEANAIWQSIGALTRRRLARGLRALVEVQAEELGREEEAGALWAVSQLEDFDQFVDEVST